MIWLEPLLTDGCIPPGIPPSLYYYSFYLTLVFIVQMNGNLTLIFSSIKALERQMSVRLSVGGHLLFFKSFTVYYDV